MGNSNEATGTSRTNPISRFLGGIRDTATNVVRLASGSNEFESERGIIKDGKFHPRTCFVKGTAVTIRKRGYELPPEAKANSAMRSIESITPSSELEELIPIEEIKVGDVVLTKSEKTDRLEYKKVTELFRHEVQLLYKITLSTGEQIVTTWNHPFRRLVSQNNSLKEREYGGLPVALFTTLQFHDITQSNDNLSSSWVEAKDLNKGDNLVNTDGKKVTIASIKILSTFDTTVYNFEVEDTHSYFVGKDRVWVHNYKLSFFTGKNGYEISASDDNSTLDLLRDPSPTPLGFKTKELDAFAIKIYEAVYGKEEGGTYNPDGTYSAGSIINRDLIVRRMDAIRDGYLPESIKTGTPSAGRFQGKVSKIEEIKILIYIGENMTKTNRNKLLDYNVDELNEKDKKEWEDSIKKWKEILRMYYKIEISDGSSSI
ncbi:MAG: Hint domain-containing protein [Leptospiraceae bacterium]|nr:Hint domain-containing protein [Leptospiraceae bacterium]